MPRDEGMDYSDMSGAASEQPVTARPSSGSHTGNTSVGGDPKRLVVIAMVGGWLLAIVVMLVVGLPLWIIGAFAVADLVAIAVMARTTLRPRP